MHSLFTRLSIPFRVDEHDPSRRFQLILRNTHRPFVLYMKETEQYWIAEVPGIVIQTPIKPETALFLFQSNKQILPFEFLYEENGEIKLVYVHTRQSESESMSETFLHNLLNNMNKCLTDYYPKMMRVIFGNSNPFQHLRTITEIIQNSFNHVEGGGEND